MRVNLVLHSILREKLPAEARGRGVIELPAHSTVGDVLARLDIPSGVVCAVNGRIERDVKRLLCEADEVELFLRIGGG